MTRFKQPGRAVAALGPRRGRREAGFFPAGPPGRSSGRHGGRRPVPPGPDAGGRAATPPAAPAAPRPAATGHGASASGHPPQATSPAPHTRLPRPILPGTASLRRGVRACAGVGDVGPCAGPAARASLGALSLSQRLIRGISSYGSTNPLMIKLGTSPGILSRAFCHRGYSLGLNHQCLSLVLLSILTT